MVVALVGGMLVFGFRRASVAVAMGNLKLESSRRYHVARRADGRWTRTLVDWEPVGGRRHWGRPVTRWEDPIQRYASSKGFNWKQRAKDRGDWDSLEDEFASKSW